VVKIGYLDQYLKGIVLRNVAETGGIVPWFFLFPVCAYHPVTLYLELIDIQLIGHIKNRDIKAKG
jgi:hypothetical protein